MSLILTLTHLNGTGHRETRTVAQGTFTIGRASGNDWILPDPDRHLSKTHCLINAEGGRFTLTDVSTNGVFVNGARQAAGRDASIVLTDGDEFRLGEYSIVVTEGPGLDATDPYDLGVASGSGAGFGQTGGGQAGAGFAHEDGPLGGDPLLDPFGGSPSQKFQHPPVLSARTQRAIDPFDAIEEAHQVSHDPEDDLFAGARPGESWKGSSQADNVDAPSQAFSAPKVLAPVNLADFDFDSLLGDLPPPGAKGPPQAPATPTGATPIARNPPAGPGALDDLSLDDLLGDAPIGTPPAPAPPAPLPAPATAAPQPNFPPAARSPSSAGEPTPPANAVGDLDLDDLLGGAPLGEPPAAFTASLPTPAPATPPPAPAIAQPAPVTANPFDEAEPPSSAAVIPRPVGTPAAASSGAAPVGQTPVTASADMAARPVPTNTDAPDLWQAFLEGVNVPAAKLGDQDPQAAMRAVGEMFRIMVEGLREVLMSRAAIKSEMRVEQTVIRAKDNNALKFSITPDEAVTAMLMPNRPGYKGPLDASREAFADIKSHELAVMAGMQTALIGLLRRFDPASLEKRLQPGKLDSLIPGARKARIWELFCATYKDLAKEAEDDFQSVFGNEFARAYDAQMRKL